MRPVRIPRLPLSAATVAVIVAVITALAACRARRRLTYRLTPRSPRPRPPPTTSPWATRWPRASSPTRPDQRETADGYPDQVYAALHRSRPGLKLVKLGCPGETTVSMINGGICRYRGGSQLAAAVAFLPAHRGQVLLVTLDIGANDPEHCGGEPSLGQLASAPSRTSRPPSTTSARSWPG